MLEKHKLNILAERDLCGYPFLLGSGQRKAHINLTGHVQRRELIALTGDWDNEALAIKKRAKSL